MRLHVCQLTDRTFNYPRLMIIRITSQCCTYFTLIEIQQAILIRNACVSEKIKLKMNCSYYLDYSRKAVRQTCPTRIKIHSKNIWTKTERRDVTDCKMDGTGSYLWDEVLNSMRCVCSFQLIFLMMIAVHKPGPKHNNFDHRWYNSSDFSWISSKMSSESSWRSLALWANPLAMS